MDQKKPRMNLPRIRLLGLAGASAFVALGTMSLVSGPSGAGATNVAGSGDAPTNTVYVQPTVAGASMGATATWTTPASVEESVSAVPPVKAGG